MEDNNNDFLTGVMFDLYKRTVEDNSQDFERLYRILVKIVDGLYQKGIFTKEEAAYLLDIEIKRKEDN